MEATLRIYDGGDHGTEVFREEQRRADALGIAKLRARMRDAGETSPPVSVRKRNVRARRAVLV